MFKKFLIAFFILSMLREVATVGQSYIRTPLSVTLDVIVYLSLAYLIGTRLVGRGKVAEAESDMKSLISVNAFLARMINDKVIDQVSKVFGEIKVETEAKTNSKKNQWKIVNLKFTRGVCPRPRT